MSKPPKETIARALQGKRYVVLAGPIGVGKSTLTREIGAMPGFVPLYEEPDKNPYLPDYYAGQAVSFEMQQYFLSQFWEGAGLVRRWLEHGHRVIQDRSVYEMLEIFSRYQNQQGQMSDRQYDIQRRLCESSFDWMPRPDLIIYLDASTGTLLERIGQRSREYEQAITPGFIDQIRVLYTEWIDQLVSQGAYIEGSSVTPAAGPWSGTRILKLEDWGREYAARSQQSMRAHVGPTLDVRHCNGFKLSMLEIERIETEEDYCAAKRQLHELTKKSSTYLRNDIQSLICAIRLYERKFVLPSSPEAIDVALLRMDEKELRSLIGRKIWVGKEKLPYTIRACNERYLVCSKLVSPPSTNMCVVLDLYASLYFTESYFSLNREIDQDFQDLLNILILNQEQVLYQYQDPLNIRALEGLE